MYLHPSNIENVRLPRVVFDDALKSNDYGQLGDALLLLPAFSCVGAILRVTLWTSLKSKCPTKCCSAAKLMVLGDDIEGGKVLRSTPMEFIG